MTDSTAHQAQASLLATARALEVDRVTAQVVDALEAAGVESILLKGPALAQWLYDDGSARGYMDSDLLVAPDTFAAATAVLRQLGFERAEEATDEAPTMGMSHAVPYFRRSDGASIDLHHTLSGATVAPAAAWRITRRHTVPLPVGGREVAAPTIPLRALIVVFHASQHGPDALKPLEDLRRAVARAPEDAWLEAAGVATELDGTAALTLGLGLIEEGHPLAARLGLADPRLARAAVTDGSGPRLALGLDRLATTPGLTAKAALLGRELVPDREFLLWWSPLARRGRVGLLAARLWRPLWLAGHLVPSLVLRRRTRGRRGEQVRRAELATLGGPFPASTKVRLMLEVLAAFPRARVAARREADIRRTLASLRGATPAPQPTDETPERDRLIFLGRRLGRAVARTMRYLPGDTRCLAQSLVLIQMLERRGIGNSLVIGVSPDGGFSAHAWVECDGSPLLPPRAEVYERLVDL